MSARSDPSRPVHRRATTRTPVARGAATLAVVMLLFFVIALTVAYTSRNLLFEQRISGNQVQATSSAEAAEAGLQWATSLLNGSRIDENCEWVAAAQPTFRARYLDIDTVTGIVTPRTGGGGAVLWAGCVFDGNGKLKCSCPASGSLPATSPDPTPTGAGPFPAFAVRFEAEPSRAGAVRIEVNGCVRWDTNCLTTVRDAGTPANCNSSICALLALNRSLKSAPAAAVTARGTATGPFTAVNTAPGTSGLAVLAGDDVQLNVTPITVTGSLASNAIAKFQTALSGLDADGTACNPDCTPTLFSSTFGLRPAAYRGKQDVVVLDCSAGCSRSDVADAVGKHPGRVLWLEGNGGLDLADGIALGSATEPVTLVVEGPVTASNATAFFGVLYGASLSGTVSLGDGRFTGAVISGSGISGNGAVVTRDPAVIDIVRFTQGSFVIVPGTWRDFP